VREVWARIEAVLRATSPDQFAALAAGATSEALQATEARLGVTLPPDVRESYTVHDGSGEIDVLPSTLYGLITVPLYSLDEMVREWQMWQQWRSEGNYHCPTSPEGPVKADRYNPRWLPVTWDGGAVNLCIDLDPAPGGVPGQMIYLDHLDPQCVATEGWRAFLEQYAADLEAGRLRFEGGELVAADADAEYTAALESLIAELKHAELGVAPDPARPD
jgi:cell wall assembly regulator SMI1